LELTLLAALTRFYSGLFYFFVNIINIFDIANGRVYNYILVDKTLEQVYQILARYGIELNLDNPDLTFGTVNDFNKEKFEKNKLDGLIVATCALVRLGLVDRITAEIPFNILEPHPLQGSLAIIVREDNYEFAEKFKKIN